VAKSTKTFGLDLDHFRELSRDRVDYVVLSPVSNVTGCVSPVKEIAEIAHEQGGLLILDAAQSAGDLDIDTQDLGVDVLAAAGHKGLYEPMGTGVIALAAPLPVKPFREGGTGFKSESPEQPEEYPWRLEVGALNLPGIAGLAAGVPLRQICRRKGHRRARGQPSADVGGRAAANGVSVYCDRAPRTGVVSFRLDCGDVALTGPHCSPAAHRAIRLSPKEPCGSVSANSTAAAMSTRSSPPSVKSGPCTPLIDPFERRITYLIRDLAFFRSAKFRLFFGCYGSSNSLIPRKISLIRGVTNCNVSG
jgi:Aminotransferase class-V